MCRQSIPYNTTVSVKRERKQSAEYCVAAGEKEQVFKLCKCCNEMNWEYILNLYEADNSGKQLFFNLVLGSFKLYLLLR